MFPVGRLFRSLRTSTATPERITLATHLECAKPISTADYFWHSSNVVIALRMAADSPLDWEAR
jgi:hypothetical protein